jgi:hypothetical protein
MFEVNMAVFSLMLVKGLFSDSCALQFCPLSSATLNAPGTFQNTPWKETPENHEQKTEKSFDC